MTKKVTILIDGNCYKYYTFLTSDETLEVGDKVVAETVHGLVIGTVKGYAIDNAKATKWIIQKIDMSAHEERQANKKRVAAIKKKLAARRKEIEEQEVLKLLAAKDEEFAELLNELNQIEGTN